jgi:hypothetical protein
VGAWAISAAIRCACWRNDESPRTVSIASAMPIASAWLRGRRAPSVSRRVLRATPALASTTLGPLANWSANSGTITSGTPGGERAEGCARPAVTDHDVGLGQHVGLVDPGLDVDIAGKVTELGDVESAANREQDSGVDPGDRRQRHPVRLGGDGHVAQDRAETHIDQRRPGTVPPVRQGNHAGRDLAEPARVGKRRGIERCGELRHVRREVELFCKTRAMVFERGSSDVDRAPLDFGEADGNLGGRDAQPMGDHRRRVLARVTQDDVGLPVCDHAVHRGQHGDGRQPTEQLAVTKNRRLASRHDG